MKVLLTGFSAFGKVRVNPSEQIVRLFAARPAVGAARRVALSRNPPLQLATAVLPVEYAAAARTIRRLIRAERPDAVLCLGVAPEGPRFAWREWRGIWTTAASATTAASCARIAELCAALRQFIGQPFRWRRFKKPSDGAAWPPSSPMMQEVSCATMSFMLPGMKPPGCAARCPAVLYTCPACPAQAGSGKAV